jgi:acetyltransferase
MPGLSVSFKTHHREDTMLEALLVPEAVAVIGASRTPGKVGYEITANLVEGGFKGELVPVNPNAKEVLGRTCYPDLQTYGKKIDLSIIVLPAKVVKAAVESSIKAGAQAIVIISAGFKEVGHEGAALEKEITEYCTSRGVRLMGPNCLGHINTNHAMNASFAKQMPETGVLSMISQSGALMTAILDWCVSERIGLAKLLSIGNKADLDETDFLAALAQDSNTKVIAGYLESINNGDEFIRVTEQVTSVKPVIIFKSGTTSSGQKAASSHTGSLAGADMAYGAAFKRSGVIRANSFEEIFDYAIAFARQPLPTGDRVCVVTNAGGPGIMAADALEHAGLKVVNPEPERAERLKAKLPAAASVANPVDVLGDADAARYQLAIESVLADENVDAVVVVLTPQAMTQPKETAEAIVNRTCKDKPIFAVFMGGELVKEGREVLRNGQIPDYPSPERAIAALKAMHEYATWKSRPPRVVMRFPVNRRRVERIIARHQRIGQLQVGEVKAKEILRAYDFEVPAGQLASNLDQAIEVAGMVGYPVAMKISSPDIVHKSDIGGVKLNLSNAEQVRDAYELMMLRIGQKMPDARLDGVYVEKMAPRGREVILGMTRDPQFGPMLMFGLGGIFVEVMKDVTFHLAPITAEEAMQMLMGTKSYALLEGARGQSAVDMAAIAGGLQRISQLVTDFPQILEMDINPFMVGQTGTPSFAADARITLGVH